MCMQSLRSAKVASTAVKGVDHGAGDTASLQPVQHQVVIPAGGLDHQLNLAPEAAVQPGDELADTGSGVLA